jgi:hypothetical protein
MNNGVFAVHISWKARQRRRRDKYAWRRAGSVRYRT